MKKKYIAYLFAILFLTLLSGIQLRWVYGSAYANPITSPVTLPITSPVVTVSPTPTLTQAPTTSPVISPIPTQTPTPTPTEVPTPTETPIPTQNPTPTPTAQNSSNSSSNSDSNSNNNPTPFVCNDSKPKTAPRLISAQITGRSNAFLTWTKAEDPVTSYLIAFGRKKGVMEYGVPNAGGHETTNYTINGLDPLTTYYFKVRAGNNCMPGDFSNELAIQVRGGNQSILSSRTTSLTKQSNIPYPVKKIIKENKTNAPLKQKSLPTQNVFSKITIFFFSLFNR